MDAVIGWVATGLVVLSYFTRRPATLRRIQGIGACLWLVYGILIHSNPVIVANILVAGAALATSLRPPQEAAAPASQP